jgi:hypothetical protein
MAGKSFRRLRGDSSATRFFGQNTLFERRPRRYGRGKMRDFQTCSGWRDMA